MDGGGSPWRLLSGLKDDEEEPRQEQQASRTQPPPSGMQQDEDGEEYFGLIDGKAANGSLVGSLPPGLELYELEGEGGTHRSINPHMIIMVGNRA